MMIDGGRRPPATRTVAGDREQRRHRVEGTDEDAEPASELTAGEQREGRHELEHPRIRVIQPQVWRPLIDVGAAVGEELSSRRSRRVPQMMFRIPATISRIPAKTHQPLSEHFLYS